MENNNKHTGHKTFGSILIILLISFILTCLVSAALQFFLNKNEETYGLVKHMEEEGKGLFYVVSYKENGFIDKQVLCTEARKDAKRHEVICREYGSGEYYIFSYPVSITDVTYTLDYFKFTQTK